MHYIKYIYIQFPAGADGVDGGGGADSVGLGGSVGVDGAEEAAAPGV